MARGIVGVERGVEVTNLYTSTSLVFLRAPLEAE